MLEEREETENAEPPEATPAQFAVLSKIFKLSLDDFAKSENYVPKLTAAFPKPKNSDVGPVPELNDYMKAGLLAKQDKDFSPDWENELRSIQSFVLHTAYALSKSHELFLMLLPWLLWCEPDFDNLFLHFSAPVLAFQFPDVAAEEDDTPEQLREKLNSLTTAITQFKAEQGLALKGAEGLNVVYELLSRLRRMNWYNLYPENVVFKRLNLVKTERFGPTVLTEDKTAATELVENEYKNFCLIHGKK